MMWELVIIFGISISGVSGSNVSVAPSKEECQSMLDNILVSSGGVNAADKEGAIIAFCRPKKKQ